MAADYYHYVTSPYSEAGVCLWLGASACKSLKLKCGTHKEKQEHRWKPCGLSMSAASV